MSDLCREVHQLLASQRRHTFPYQPKLLPSDGVYVLYEKGEISHGTDRIVRVGTHDGDGRLAVRLEEHFLRENKDRSVFRKNVGRALLAAARDPFLKQWEIDRTKKSVRDDPTRQVDTKMLQRVERRVTERIRQYFSFAVIPIPPSIDRHLLEARLIATIASCTNCRPSPAWLGLASPNAKIRTGGLWQVQHLDDAPFTEADMEMLRRLLAGSSVLK